MFLSIITPTFNRASYLQRVYNSLISQTDFDFEWILYDDGSSDNTREVVKDFYNDKFSIRYYYHENIGFTFTLYEGIKLARGEYFVVICSDDVFPSEGIQLYKHCSFYTQDDYYGGFFLLGADIHTGKVVGNLYPKDMMECSYIDELLKYKLVGDKQRVYKTKIFINYNFRMFDQEYYVPEAVFTLEISQSFKFMAFNEIGYFFEYLEDGITHNSNKIYRDNPNGMYCRYLLQSNMSADLKSFIVSIIYGRNSGKNFRDLYAGTHHKVYILLLYVPIIIFHYYIRRNKILMYSN